MTASPSAVPEVHPSVQGHPLETDPSTFGELRRTSPDSPIEAIRQAMTEDGYVFLPGFFERERVLAVRQELVRRLDDLGVLAAGTDVMDGILRDEVGRPAVTDNYHKLAVGNAPLHALLYEGSMINFWERFLGGPVLHFDYTWIRATPPGRGTPAHTDIVFMGRGTQQLYTAWVPYGDISLQLGGLAVLEGGQRHAYIHEEYGSQDVDTFCENHGEQPTKGPDPDRSLLDPDPAALRRRMGGRWLTTSYSAGDLMIFGMFLPHVGIDNQTTNQIRLSSDARYQLASEDVDERWVGSDPVGHGPGAKVGLIC